MAHALVIQVKLPEGGDPEMGRRMLQEQVVPQAKAHEGFVKGIWMNEANNGLSIVIFDTAEHATAAQETMRPPPGGPQLVSSVIYQVAAQA